MTETQKYDTRRPIRYFIVCVYEIRTELWCRLSSCIRNTCIEWWGAGMVMRIIN